MNYSNRLWDNAVNKFSRWRCTQTRHHSSESNMDMPQYPQGELGRLKSARRMIEKYFDSFIGIGFFRPKSNIANGELLNAAVLKLTCLTAVIILSQYL